ncbi:Ca-activated chloride channel family protein [Cupriavidus sp. YR651]|uniref:vWA domain-containing protein n=1 Tax=Cupriavidus sp. YR651 TaxID=1855315 RepID=UPI000891B4E5|nr:VWA domain-containing protein [Cupriavidus sp. YR651]SDD25176.1 Ca-activated chloride channel family protein [Cupriavidus sp. YR651]
MHPKFALPALAATIALTLAACGGGVPVTPPDQRPDTATDTGPNTRPNIRPENTPNNTPGSAPLLPVPRPTPPYMLHPPADASGQTSPGALPSAPLAAQARKDAATRTREPARAPMAESRAMAPSAMRVMPAPSYLPAPAPQDRERYGAIEENGVRQVAQAPVSTFSIDVDTGSYSNVRRMLNAGRLPPADAVRVEELVNYFPYDYAPPTDGRPFAVHAALAPAPWQSENVLLRIGIKGEDVARASLPPANLVFLVDVSGSMHSPDKLPLLKSSLKLLVGALRPQDRITLVTYAGTTRVALPPTPGSEKTAISAAIDQLMAGGSTAGASGIALAYQAAQQSYIPGGINRVLLATDGDFNVGITDFRQLKSLVEEKRKSGVSLSTLGFGTGNYNDQLMEQLADAGDGAYSYIDNLMEGNKVLVSEMSATLATIARDVKIQVEFNPATVREYRLIGYENRLLAREDFNNDKVDAGDIGAGHTVTALYELTLTNRPGLIDDLRYQPAASVKAAQDRAGELAHIKLRYKQPTASTSQLMDVVVNAQAIRPLAQGDADFRFAAAVSGFGQVLRGGKFTGQWRYDDVHALAQAARGADRFGYRGEFLKLVALAQSLSTSAATTGATGSEEAPPRAAR